MVHRWHKNATLSDQGCVHVCVFLKAHVKKTKKHTQLSFSSNSGIFFVCIPNVQQAPITYHTPSYLPRPDLLCSVLGLWALSSEHVYTSLKITPHDVNVMLGRLRSARGGSETPTGTKTRGPNTGLYCQLIVLLRSVFSQPLLARFPPKEKKLCIVGEHEHGDPKSYFQNDPQNFSFFSPDACAAPCVRGTPLPLYIHVGSVPPPGVQAAARTRNQTASTLSIVFHSNWFELAQNRFEIALSFPHDVSRFGSWLVPLQLMHCDLRNETKILRETTGLDPDPKSDRCISTEICYCNFGKKLTRTEKIGKNAKPINI